MNRTRPKTETVLTVLTMMLILLHVLTLMETKVRVQRTQRKGTKRDRNYFYHPPVHRPHSVHLAAG